MQKIIYSKRSAFNLLLDLLEAFYIPQEVPWFDDSFCRYMYWKLEGY